MRSLRSSPFQASFVFKTNIKVGCLRQPSSRRLNQYKPTHSTRERNGLVVCKVRSIFDDEGRRFSGVYGPWEITRQDVIEVWTYRVSLTAVSIAFVTEAVTTLFDLFPTHSPALENILAGLGIAALGVALSQIHIYITEIKRALQLLWGIGTLGFVYILLHSDGVAAAYVANNPPSVWLIGPLFASLVGLTFKEGLCYGKLEAYLLTLLTPVLLLGHLLGWLPQPVEWLLLCSILTLLLYFSFGKYGQDIKDDIGDGSVFAFRKMRPEEQEALLRQAENDLK